MSTPFSQIMLHPPQVDPTWTTMMRELADFQNKMVLDIGCKEGLFTKRWPRWEPVLSLVWSFHATL